MACSQPTTQPQTSGRSVLRSALADDPDFLEILRAFVDELPGHVAAIESALAEHRIEQVARLAHQIKGAGGGYGYPEISAAAGELERHCAADADLEQARQDLDDLAQLSRAAARGLAENDAH